MNPYQMCAKCSKQSKTQIKTYHTLTTMVPAPGRLVTTLVCSRCGCVRKLKGGK